MSPRRTASLALLALWIFATPCFGHVVLDAPNGGEILPVGSVFTITWHLPNAHEYQNWDLWYSTSGPDGPWIPIALDLPPGSFRAGSIHTHDWTIPAEAVSDEVRVRLRMDSFSDQEDISDGDFTVTRTSPAFVRGDVDGDNEFTGLNDILYLLAFQFTDGPAPPCLEAGDADADGVLNGLSDALFLLWHQFLDGAPPPPPYPNCEAILTALTLGCDTRSCP